MIDCRKLTVDLFDISRDNRCHAEVVYFVLSTKTSSYRRDTKSDTVSNANRATATATGSQQDRMSSIDTRNYSCTTTNSAASTTKTTAHHGLRDKFECQAVDTFKVVFPNDVKGKVR